MRGRASRSGWMLWTRCHNSRRLSFTRLPRLLLPFHFTSSAPSHFPPLHTSISPPLRGIVGSHLLISSYLLSPRYASQHCLIFRTEPMCKKCFRMSRDTPTDPRTLGLCRACSSAATGRTQTYLRGPSPISTLRCMIHPPCSPRRSLHV